MDAAPASAAALAAPRVAQKRRFHAVSGLGYWLTVTTCVIIWAGMLAMHADPADWEVLNALYAGDHPLLARMAMAMTAFGSPTIRYLVPALAGLVLAARKRLIPALAVVLIPPFGSFLDEVQKKLFSLPRPPEQFHLIHVQTYGFPSGHSAGSLMVYLTAALLVTQVQPFVRWRWHAICCALAISLLVGASRIMIGVHWPTDVIGGWAFGAFWILICLRAERELRGADVRLLALARGA
ncbi:phosphatase PAP2 family protein [Sphingomonas sp. F9_3S_D5_B_2]